MIVIGVCGHVLVMCWSCACHVSSLFPFMSEKLKFFAVRSSINNSRCWRSICSDRTERWLKQRIRRLSKRAFHAINLSTSDWMNSRSSLLPRSPGPDRYVALPLRARSLAGQTLPRESLTCETIIISKQASFEMHDIHLYLVAYKRGREKELA